MESVPPQMYGGTERVVSYLTEELVRQGHHVTLFASGDSITSAQLVPCADRAMRLDSTNPSPLPQHLIMVEKLRRHAADFDVIHFHVDYLHFPLCRHSGWHTLTTLHGRLDLPEVTRFYREFDELPLVSISNSQRQPMPPVNWAGTVYHGLPVDLYAFNERPDDYVAFVGRISPEKRPDRAIEIARRAGIKLKIAAKVDRVDEAYYAECIRPLLADPYVEFIGEIGDDEKRALLSGARALLFPVNWPEPFGLVMIEAMACGTPVVAYRCGAVPEVIKDGVSGFIVGNMEDAVAAVGRIDRLPRAGVRAEFEWRFTAERMALDYVGIYNQLAAPTRKRRIGSAPAAKPVSTRPLLPAPQNIGPIERPPQTER
jgi:glycosyltransferase involved in cell wall biosynthesis